MIFKGIKTFGNYFQTSSNHIPSTIYATYKIPCQTSDQKLRYKLINFYRSASVANYLASVRTCSLLILFQLPSCIEYRLFSIEV